MNRELPPPVAPQSEAQQQPVVEQIRFMSPAFMDDVRRQQREYLASKNVSFPNSELPKELSQEQLAAQQELAQFNREYVDNQIDQSVPPSIREDLVRSMNRYSVFAMDDVTWEKGETDHESKSIKPETSGKASLTREIERLERVLRDPRDALVEARLELAKLSIERRRKLSDRNKKLQQAYEQQTKVYASYQEQVGKDLVTKLRNEGKNDIEIQQEITAFALEEYRAFTKAEFEVLQSDNSKRGKVARFLAKSNRRFFTTSFLAGGIMGAGARQVLGTAGIATGVGLGAAVAIGIGVGTTRAALTSLIGVRKLQITEHEQRADQDLQRFSQVLTSGPQGEQSSINDNNRLNEVLAYSNTLRNERINTDQSDNRRRLGKAALFGAAGGALGAFGGMLVSHLIDNWPGSGSSDRPSNPAPETTPPESSDPSPPNDSEQNGNGNSEPPAQEPPENDIPPEINNTVTIESGEGITYGLQDLGREYDVNLSAEESYAAYQYIENQVGNEFFAAENTYTLPGGDYGVSRAGDLRWNPTAMEAFHRWMIENNKVSP